MRTDETEVPLCLNCLEPIDTHRDFCEKCGAPISTYFWLDPLKRLYGAGYVYRKLVGRRNRPVVYYTSITFLILQLAYLVFSIPGYTYFDKNDELITVQYDTATLAFMGASFAVSLILLLRIIANMRRDYAARKAESRSLRQNT